MAEPRRTGGGFQMGDAVVRAGANGAEGQGDPLPARHSADDPQRGRKTSEADRLGPGPAVTAGPVEGSNDRMNDDSRTLLVRLGKAQIDGMFARQDEGPAIDDS